MAADADTILFDLDGTLVDSRPAMIASIRAAIDGAGLDSAAVTWEDIRPMLGPPLYDGFAALLPRLGGDPALSAECVQAYRRQYAELMLPGSQLYEGIGAALDELSERAKLLVATSKPGRFAEPLLSELGIIDRFQAVFAPEADLRPETKAQTIARALECARGTAAVMVGDTIHDVGGARANQIPCIAVLWGFGTREELAAAGASALVAAPADLPDALATS